MKKNNISFLLAVFIFGLSAGLAQVQLFEQNRSGIVPFIGANAAADIQEWTLGAGYFVEGKFGMGISYAKALTDTLYKKDPDIKSQTIKPFISMEIIEPDKQFPLSFTMQLNYAYHNGEADSTLDYLTWDSTAQDWIWTSESRTWRQHTSHIVSGGPAVGMRFYIGNTGIIAPNLGYAFSYVFNEKSYWVTKSDTVNNVAIETHENPLEKNRPMLHDIYLDIPYSHMFNDMIGIMARPKIIIRLDEKSEMSVFASLHVGLVAQFF